MAVLNEIVAAARGNSKTRVRGEYIPSGRNGMVADHYAKLGFTEVGSSITDGVTLWQLALNTFTPIKTEIEVTR